MKQVIVTPNAPAAIGPYSQGIAAGQTVYVSGQLPIDPATGLIPEGIAAQTAQSLKNIQAILAQQGMTMLVVTHEMGFARNVSSKTVFMENGVVVEQAPSQQFFASPKEERTRAFLRRIAHTE